MQDRLIIKVGDLIVVLIVAVCIVFELSPAWFAVAIGIALFLKSLIEDKPLEPRHSFYVVLGSAVTFVVGIGVAYAYGIGAVELLNSFKLGSCVPFLAVGGGVLGSCQLVRSLVTGQKDVSGREHR